MLIIEYGAVSSAFADILTALVLLDFVRDCSKRREIILETENHKIISSPHDGTESMLAIEAARAKSMDTDVLINSLLK